MSHEFNPSSGGSYCIRCGQSFNEGPHTSSPVSTTPTTQSREAELREAIYRAVSNHCGHSGSPATNGDCPQCTIIASEAVTNILTSTDREAELAKALQWALDRLPACVAMPTSHDFNQYEKYRVLASTTPAPVGDESPSLAKARREGALAALTYASNHSPSSTWNEVDGQITVCTCGWKCDAVKIHIIRERWTKHILSLPITTILAQHRDVPAGAHLSDDQDNSPICRANDRSGR